MRLDIVSREHSAEQINTGVATKISNLRKPKIYGGQAGKISTIAAGCDALADIKSSQSGHCLQQPTSPAAGDKGNNTNKSASLVPAHVILLVGHRSTTLPPPPFRLVHESCAELPLWSTHAGYLPHRGTVRRSL